MYLLALVSFSSHTFGQLTVNASSWLGAVPPDSIVPWFEAAACVGCSFSLFAPRVFFPFSLDCTSPGLVPLDWAPFPLLLAALESARRFHFFTVWKTVSGICVRYGDLPWWRPTLTWPFRLPSPRTTRLGPWNQELLR